MTVPNSVDPEYIENMRIATALGRLDVRIVAGPPEVAVLWHSLFTDSRSWEPVLDRLAGHRTLVLVDGWSFGASDDLLQTIPDFIDGCAQAADLVIETIHASLAFSGPVDWLGSAWGGHVGLHLAAKNPHLVRSLTTVSTPVTAANDSIRRQVKMLLPLYRVIGMRSLVRRGILDGMLGPTARHTDRRAVDALVRPMSGKNRAAIARTVRSAVLNRRDLTWAIGAISCPTLMVATNDRGEWTPEECAATTATMTDARSAVITGSRALPSVEAPEQLADLITNFWQHPRTIPDLGTAHN